MDGASKLVPSTIRTIIGPKAPIYRLEDFLRLFVPSCEGNFQVNTSLGRRQNDVIWRLSETLVSPNSSDFDLTLVLATTKLNPSQESLSTLVDDVIWSMVTSPKSKARQNVLSKGYVVASEVLEAEISRCAHMRAGVMCERLNGNVSFCKTSRYFQTLHSMVGDDVIRILLKQTSMFVPFHEYRGESKTGNLSAPKQNQETNYMLVCGSVPELSNCLIPACKPDGHELPSIVKKSENGRSKRSRKGGDASATGEEGSRKKKRLDALSPQAPLNRKSMFYSDAYLPKVGLPRNHILNETTKGRGEVLLKHIIPFRDAAGGRKKRKRWNRLRSTGPPICSEILRRHSKCDYHRLLEQHCPLSAICKQKQEARKKNKSTPRTADPVTLSQLSASHSDSDGVVAFVRDVIRAVFPDSFWGSSHNSSRVLALVETFVKLRRREDLPNKTIMKGVQITSFKWLLGTQTASANKSRKLPRAAHEAATRLATMVMRWFFNHFIVPLLRSNFYVTESEFTGKRVLFYRKPVWALFRSLSMNHLLQKQYREISLEETKNRLKTQQMGCSRLRLLPKTTGVRPIATLCKRERTILTHVPGPHNRNKTEGPKRRRLNRRGFHAAPPLGSVSLNTDGPNRFKATNDILRDAFQALKFEQQANPGLFGAGLLGLSEFYPRYRALVSRILPRKRKTGSLAGLGLFFASVDVRHCYDNIDQENLLQIVLDVLSEEDYMINRYSELHASESMGRIVKKRRCVVGPPDTFGAFQKWTSSNSRGAVALDEANSSLASKEKILALVREHLMSHLVVARGRRGSRCLLQARGIPQGSILSAFLCNFYYGANESQLVGSAIHDRPSDNELSSETHVNLLVRIIDDFLFITTDETKHKAFLQEMYTGKPSLGVCINKGKIFSNSKVTVTGEDGSNNTIQDTTLGQFGLFPWCGMLFDTESLEVKIDYSRFKDERAGNNLTVARSEEGSHLRNAMKNFVRPRCLPILFDPSINGQQTLDANFFDMLLLCASKTESYIRSGDMMETPTKNTVFLISCIEDTILFSHRIILDKLQRESATKMKGEVKSKLDLSRQLALSLGWHAFSIAFQKPLYRLSLWHHMNEKLRSFPNWPRVLHAVQSSPQRTLMLKET